MDLTWSAVMTISGDSLTYASRRKPIKTLDSPLEDFEPMPEGDKQRRNLSYATEALKLWFEQLPDVYVSGNMFIRYEKDGAEKRIAPDIFVVFGTSKEDRVSYTVWEEEQVPDFVLEITSKGTVTKDRDQNPLIYRDLGVKEYFQYDPTGEYLKPTSLQGVRLKNGEYVAIASSVLPDGTLSLHSQTLGLDLHLYPNLGFRFFDPISNEILRSYAEAEFERVFEQRARFQAELERSFEHQARLEAEAARLEAEAAQQEAEAIANRANLEKQLAEQKAQRLAEMLKAMGIDPDEI
jgi:Uma2 family endonuclease